MWRRTWSGKTYETEPEPTKTDQAEPDTQLCSTPSHTVGWSEDFKQLAVATPLEHSPTGYLMESDGQPPGIILREPISKLNIMHRIKDDNDWNKNIKNILIGSLNFRLSVPSSYRTSLSPPVGHSSDMSLNSCWDSLSHQYFLLISVSSWFGRPHHSLLFRERALETRFCEFRVSILKKSGSCVGRCTMWKHLWRNKILITFWAGQRTVS